MFRTNLLGGMAVVALLGGCAGQDIDALRGATGDGSPFTQALTEQYKALSVFEADRMYDWRDAGVFARKGLAAAQGKTVAPEKIETRDLPAAKIEELTLARERLLGALAAAAAEKLPREAAKAQTQFDCWIEQQEENHQAAHIAACRKGFYGALGEIEAGTAPAAAVLLPAVAPAAEPAVASAPLIVRFAFDSAVLLPETLDAVRAALAQAKASGHASLAVTGHADSAGPQDYNLRLSLRRAEAIKDALLSLGAGPDDIVLSGHGETRPAVVTPDNVREPANRRVEIVIQ